MYSDLETRVTGHSRLLEPTRIDSPPTIKYIHNMIHSNHGPIS